MSGGIGMARLPDWDALTKEAFLSFAREPGALEYWTGLFKRKPRVRVQAPRQTPNECDL